MLHPDEGKEKMECARYDREIIELYQDGETIENISIDLDISKYSVAKTLHKNNVKMRPAHTKPMPDGIKQMITNDWNAGHTAARIANVYGYTEKSIRYILVQLRKEGYKLRPRQMNRSHQAEGIVQDWNAGATIEELAYKYDFRSKGSVYDHISRLRKQGYDARYRQAYKK